HRRRAGPRRHRQRLPRRVRPAQHGRSGGAARERRRPRSHLARSIRERGDDRSSGGARAARRGRERRRHGWPAACRRRRGIRRSDDGRRPAVRGARRRACRPGGARDDGGARDPTPRRAARDPSARVRVEVAVQPRGAPPRRPCVDGRDRGTRRVCRAVGVAARDSLRGRRVAVGVLKGNHETRRSGGSKPGSRPSPSRRSRGLTWPLLATAAFVVAPMLIETAISARNERGLRALGAVEPGGDVARAMPRAYPAAFVVMMSEGALGGVRADGLFAAGLAVFASAKALKYWAIASLGPRWTFRVLVPPGSTRTARGPY